MWRRKRERMNERREEGRKKKRIKTEGSCYGAYASTQTRRLEDDIGRPMVKEGRT